MLFQVLDSFSCFLIGFYSHTYNALLLWRKKTGQSIRTRTFSDTRWWSKWRCVSKCWSPLGCRAFPLQKTRKFAQKNVTTLEIFGNQFVFREFMMYLRKPSTARSGKYNPTKPEKWGRQVLCLTSTYMLEKKAHLK